MSWKRAYTVIDNRKKRKAESESARKTRPIESELFAVEFHHATVERMEIAADSAPCNIRNAPCVGSRVVPYRFARVLGGNLPNLTPYRGDVKLEACQSCASTGKLLLSISQAAAPFSSGFSDLAHGTSSLAAIRLFSFQGPACARRAGAFQEIGRFYLETLPTVRSAKPKANCIGLDFLSWESFWPDAPPGEV